jgi:hypothetical protein
VEAKAQPAYSKVVISFFLNSCEELSLLTGLHKSTIATFFLLGKEERSKEESVDTSYPLMYEITVPHSSLARPGSDQL